jgi:hypothetical protein
MSFAEDPADRGIKMEVRVMLATGYRHSDYARSFIEFGQARALPQSEGWCLKRPIAGTSDWDAMGCYPIFVCENWEALSADLEQLRHEVVSFAVVTDPFGAYDASLLHACFPDVVRPFKQHCVVDLSLPMNSFVSAHHRRNMRKAASQVGVELCEAPTAYVDTWCDLYGELKQRHEIHGMAAFSHEAFARQLAVPGMVAFRARQDEKTVGMLLWYVHGPVGYYHLAAYNPVGYEVGASFALFGFALEYFASQGLQWLSLGASAGVGGAATDGLSRFKKGWSTGTRQAYFCGRIFDRARYQELVQAKGVGATPYFPAYRYGEFQ